MNGPARQPGQRESIVIRPPRRPQARRPRYADREREVAQPSAPLAVEPNDQQQEQPAHEAYAESASNDDREQSEDVPTRPLNPDGMIPAIEQAASTPETRRKLWKQFQRIFKNE